MLRAFRRADIPAFYALMTSEFPEESEVYRWNAEPYARVVAKLQGFPYHLLLGLLNAIGKPVFRFYVLEVEGEYAASAIQSFGPHLAYVSSVVVAPKFRRRGYAKRLLEACHAAAAARKEKFVALDVLDGKTAAAALYDSLGYRPISHASHFLRGSLAEVGPGPAAPSIRPFRFGDAEALAEIARSWAPAARQEVHPVSAAEFHVAGAVVRALDSKTAAWVVDTGAGPVAWVRASASPVMAAGHLTAPVIASGAPPDAVGALVANGLAWLRSNGARRAVAEVLDENVRAAAALRLAGFEVAFGSRTLARPTGVA
jgi:ribosomal protein S18 acetylase RimI-like enzyme